jgi:hypothetical protein
MGCNCNSNNGCNGMLATLQTGDTFPVYLDIKDNGGVKELAEGYDLIAGFYDRKKQLLLRAGTDDGRISYNDETNLYMMTVSHEESLLMKGTVYVELTLTENDKRKVYHGDKVVPVGFEGRNNNDIITTEQ